MLLAEGEGQIGNSGPKALAYVDIGSWAKWEVLSGNSGQTQRIVKNMLFADFADQDKRWERFLGSEKCPPILGLAPLSEEDSGSVSALVRVEVSRRLPFATLLDLLQFRPAIMTVWLARKAGEAYEFGTFWELFERNVGVVVPPNERSTFAARFQESCSRVMSTYVEPTNLGAFKYVETFLFQAGLLLCHCQKFADCLREVERRYG